MTKNILVFLPNTLNKHNTGYLQGFYKDFEDCEAYYITSDKVQNNFCGCISFLGKSYKNTKLKINNYLFINCVTGNTSVIKGNEKICPSVDIIYDYKGFKNSDVVNDLNTYGVHFKILSDELRRNKQVFSADNGRKSTMNYLVICILFLIGFVLKVFNIFKPVLAYSATFSHFEESVIMLKWFLETLVKEKQITPKTGNAAVAKIIDLLVGIILVHWFWNHEDYVINIIETKIEAIIANLKGLLMYLMGSPIGLKLNFSFNKSLGTFFFYHISLWKIFLQEMQPLLNYYFRPFVLLGALGFSFQVAIFSDLISMATFHVYCIYVYAARLFKIEIKGLISLWRLFIGRKYNPLRQRVDSCQYSQNQLFIGTLGFTIFLFLLPTTTMYYTVFTTFRLVIVTVDGALLRIQYFLKAFPLYITIVWICSSPNIAGMLYMKWTNSSEDNKPMFEAKLNTLPLSHSIKKFVPDPVHPIKSSSLGHVFHCVLTGILI